MDSIFSNDQYYYNEEEDYPEEDLTPNFYDWKDIFPQLKVLIDSIDIIKEEAKNIKNVKHDKLYFILYNTHIFFFFLSGFLGLKIIMLKNLIKNGQFFLFSTHFQLMILLL